MGSYWNMVLQRYGEYWRRHRRTMHEKFHPSAVEAYKPIQVKHTRELLRRLLKHPENFMKHIRHSAGAIIMEIGYGIRVEPENDPYIFLAEQYQRAGGEAAIPGRFLVDLLPWMKYIPDWVPGADFKKQAKIWKSYGRAMVDLPFQAVKEAMATGNAGPSFTSYHLEKLAAKHGIANIDVEEEVIKNTAAIIFAAGADTTVNTLETFILAMVLFPEIQRKAQAELDTVLGGVRLPEFEDREFLPYTVAVYKEIMRWHPLLPLGVAHAVTQDDVVNGYFIPKGAIVFGNTWALLHDEVDFGPDTDKFNPDRFLQPGVRDPASTGAFGLGRRICPGRYMAENSLFIVVASILQVFDISRPKDGAGNDLPLDFDWTPGIFSSPTDFKCTLRPRSRAAEELIVSSSETSC